VPLPVRLLAQDLAQFGQVALFLGIIGLLMQGRTMDTPADLDIALPAVFLGAVLWGRFATTIAAARRVTEAGYSPEEIVAGFGRLLDEREGERARLRTLPAVRARRRFSVRMFAAMIGTALVMVWFALRNRVLVEPGRYVVPRPMVVMLVSAVIMLGMAFIGLLRNPFRATVGERLFRVVWMGWPGRAFLRLAARGVKRSGGTLAATTRAVRDSAASEAAARDGVARTGQVASEDAVRLARLEARVDALERAREPTR
jgi:hypothetical protein